MIKHKISRPLIKCLFKDKRQELWVMLNINMDPNTRRWWGSISAHLHNLINVPIFVITAHMRDELFRSIKLHLRRGLSGNGH